MACFRRRIALTVTAFVVVLLAACDDFVHPLSDPAEAKQDTALYGCWVRDGEYLFIGKDLVAHLAERRKDRDEELEKRKVESSTKKYLGLMRLQRVQVDESSRVVGPDRLFDSTEYNDSTMWVTEVGGRKYANLVKGDTGRIFEKDWGTKPGERTLLIRLEVTKNKLRIWQADTELLAKAVDGGKLRGKIQRSDDGKTVTSVSITEKSEGLRDFIKDGGELFTKEPTEYTRGKVVIEK